MCRILNKHKDNIPKDAVYIGRGSPFGNPFVIGADGNRAEVVQKYYEWILQNEQLMNKLDELKGKDLVCFCSPQLCHGDVLQFLIEM